MIEFDVLIIPLEKALFHHAKIILHQFKKL